MSLRVEHVSFNYPNLPVLREVSFDVPPGDFLSLLGPNGSGKSTLLRLLDRILLPHAGTIRLFEKHVSDYSRRELARIIAYVPQDGTWMFPFTVLEVVLMGRSPHVGRLGFENEQDLAIADEIMKLTDVAHLAKKPITALSGGERQRVLIARALCQQPKMLLLDEPNAHLDISHQIEIFKILRKQNEEGGLTVLSVSHDLNLAAAFSKRVLLLAPSQQTGERNGSTTIALGTPAEVLTKTNIEEVFQTPVLVDRHPETSSVRISLIPEIKKQPRGKTVRRNETGVVDNS